MDDPRRTETCDGYIFDLLDRVVALVDGECMGILIYIVRSDRDSDIRALEDTIHLIERESVAFELLRVDDDMKLSNISSRYICLEDKRIFLDFVLNRLGILVELEAVIWSRDRKYPHGCIVEIALLDDGGLCIGREIGDRSADGSIEVLHTLRDIRRREELYCHVG